MTPPAAMAPRSAAQSTRRAARAVVLRAAPGVVLAALAALAATGAAAQNLPKLAPGLWEMNPTSGAASAQANANRITLCVDASLSKQMFEIGAGAMSGACSRHEFHVSGNRGRGDFVCEIGGSRMHSTSTMVMQGDRAYRTEVHTTWDPPFAGRATADTVLTARWLGPCPPGQRPGDMTTAQGRKLNIRDALQGKGKAMH